MKRIFLLGSLLVAVVVMVGCGTYVSQSQQSGPLGVKVAAPMKADIEVGEKISGTASGTLLCGCLPIGLPKKFAEGVEYNYYHSWFPTRLDFNFIERSVGQIKAGAAYNAVAGSKADVIVAPKYIIEDNNYLLFDTLNITVVGYKGTVKSIKATDNFKEEF